MADCTPASPHRVLIVDDTPANIDVLRAMLEADGHSVSFATSGEQALKLASRLPVDLILLDVMMPGLDGYETCKHLKTLPATRDVPVIFVTARTESDDIVRGFAVGAVDYVPKPFRRAEVCARVRTQLRIRSLLLEQARVAEREHEQARRLQEVFETIEDGIFTLDPEGVVLTVNPAGERLFGRPSEALVGRPLSDLVRLEEADEEVEVEEPPSDGETLQPPRSGRFQVVGAQPDGSSFAIDLTITRLQCARPFFVAVLHDITAQKATEDELRRASRTDQLTELPNRRRFREYLDLEWRRGLRACRPVGLLMIDVDFFKLYNDTYGHQAGDACLRRVAQAIRTACQRASDLAARYGGEEFAVILPETDEVNAVDVAEKIRTRVAALRILHQSSEAAEVVTVSVGVASLIPDSLNSTSMLVAIADQALYQAKARGRNRVAH